MKTSFWTKIIFLAAICIIIMSSCKDKKPLFTIEGSISNADTIMLYLERRSLTETMIIDSIKLDKSGNFKFTKASLDYPEFYLLRLNNQSINLAVDSTETITIKAPSATFALDYTVEGSNSSAKIKDVVLAQNKLSLAFADLKNKFENKEISQDEYVNSFRQVIDEYKTKAKDLIYTDYQSLASYFALFQKVDGYLIFDPYDKKDLAAFQAIATVWDQYKSKSPRAAQLKDFTLAAISEVRKMAQQEETIKKLVNAEPTDDSAYYDILLPDMSNNKISLSSLKGKVVILDFTIYQSDFSPAHNIVINNVYNKYKGNVEVYQVSLDPDIHAWQNSAINLPWTCVRENNPSNTELLTKYNIRGIPTTFLINKKGEIAKRIFAEDDLAAEVQKLL